MSSKKESRKSASKWCQSSETALFKVWGKSMKELLACKKNSHIVLKMMMALQAQGHNYSDVELRTKMHNITARYRKERRKMAIDGLPSEWELFKEVDLLLGPYTHIYSEGVLADNINNINSSIIYQPLLPTVTSPMTSSSPKPSPYMPASSPLTLPSTPADSPLPHIPPDAASSSSAAMIKQDVLEKIFQNLETSIEQINEDIKNTTERMIAIEEEKKEMLRIYIDRESEVQKALIEFLKRS